MKKHRSSSAAENQPRRHFPRLSLILLGGFLLLMTLWLGGRPVMRWWRYWQARELLTSARLLMEKEEWGEAARCIREASAIAPDDPEVVRGIAAFQIQTHSHPSDVVQTLQRLSGGHDAATEDLAKLARAQVDLGSHEAARKTLAQLPEAIRANNAQAAEAEAYLLKMERRDSEADSRLRVALNNTSGDAQAVLKMAILDLKQPHPEVRQRGRRSLWRMAQDGGGNAAEAISILTADPTLSAWEAERLLEMVERLHLADGEELRYSVLSALVRLRPEGREVILNRETLAADGADESQRLACARWLSSLGEHQRLMDFLPPELKWKDMPVDMVRLKLEALAQAGRWDDVRKALNRDMEKVLGAVSFHLWLARLVSTQGGEAARVHQHLNLAFGATDRGQDSQAAVLVAEAAERLGALDLATDFYHATAAQASAAQFRLSLLEKAYALHLNAHNTHGMLKMATEVASLTPGHQANAFRADYLALLVGESIEVVASRIASMQSSADGEASLRLQLLRAMASHRLHAPQQEPGTLKKLIQLTWAPGERAVLAAMLASQGDAATGFQIAEKIAATLLLPEEKKFLALAK